MKLIETPYIFELEKNNIKFDYDYLCELENKNFLNITKEEEEYLLQWIISRVECFLPSDNPTYNYLCGLVADLLGALLKSLKIHYYQVNIGKILNENRNIHAITIVNFFPDDKYIIDPTFRQFLVKERLIEDRKIIYNNWKLKYPGYFLSLTEKGSDFGKFLLNNGYFKLTNENLKIYCDAFIMYRNTLKKKNINYNIKTGEQYMKELYKCDEHEVYDIDENIKLTPKQLIKK